MRVPSTQYRLPFEYFIKWLISTGVFQLTDINAQLKQYLCPELSDEVFAPIQIQVGSCPVSEKLQSVTNPSYKQWLTSLGVLSLHYPSRSAKKLASLASDWDFWRAFTSYMFYYRRLRSPNIFHMFRDSLVGRDFDVTIEDIKMFYYYFCNDSIMTDASWSQFRHISPYQRIVSIGLSPHSSDPVMLAKCLGEVTFVDPSTTLKMMMADLHAAYVEVSDIPPILGSGVDGRAIRGRKEIVETYLKLHEVYIESEDRSENIIEDMSIFIEENTAPTLTSLSELRDGNLLPDAVREDRLLPAGD
ncbi:hypothetical protein LCGC14_0147080 [marine sediment metagenome]|uniref:Uncharacterized protein n=1 Tax=marine sediment metagenome TaxID=412755 RepID=A0A0F9XHM2_9ZZZZ